MQIESAWKDRLVQRGDELAALDAAILAARTSGGRVVVIEGPPGIGKSALLDLACNRARANEMHCLRARGDPLELWYAYGVVRQLLEPALSVLTDDERAQVLHGIASDAAAALRGEPRPAVTDEPEAEAALHYGLYWIVVSLAERRPLLLTVDDAHWADAGSLRWLSSLARRVDGLSASLVVAARAGSGSVLEMLSAAPEAVLLRPEPLNVSSIAELMNDRVGVPDPAAAELAHVRTGGNPLLVRELLKALRGVVSVDRVAEAGGRTIAQFVRAQLDSLGPAAAALALAVAVLGDGATLLEAANTADLEMNVAADTASQLIASDILFDDSSLTFRHPLLRDVVLEGLSVPARRAAHRRAAIVLHRRGAPVERIAAQLLVGEAQGGRWAVDVLRSVAQDAVDRGSPEVAAKMLARALEEPPPKEMRAAILGELGAVELRAGTPAGSERLREAIHTHEDRREKARLALVLGLELAGMQREREAADVLSDGVAHAHCVDRDLEMRLTAHLAHTERYDLNGGNASVTRLQRLATGLAGDTPTERLVLAMDAALRPARDAAEAAAFAGRIEMAWSEALVSLRAATGAVAMYIHAGELERAASFADNLLTYTQRRSLAFGHARASSMVAMVALAAGRLADAEASLVGTVDVETYGLPRPAVAVLVELLVETGRLGVAETVLSRHGADGPLPRKMLMNPLLMARARLHVALHRTTDALSELFELGDRYAEWGLAGRPMPPWRGLAAVLLAMTGESEHADELAGQQVELARQWGSDHALGVALSALGTVRQDTDVLSEAVRLLGSTPFRLDHAHALVELGALRRRKRLRAAAIEPLQSGMDLAHRYGAAALVDRARSELLACGSRPRRPARSGREALTPSELRVAQMAAGGLSNREIAQALFITIPTVTTHLGHAYQKLDIAGRRQLTGALAEG
jgi:DNA-binding CsgD family transcriptional regulator